MQLSYCTRSVCYNEMMQDLTIQNVKLGPGLGQSRVALIFAPRNAPPGSLTALTQFLNQVEGIRAVPGYHGPNQNHVLRVSGIQVDNTTFMRWLQRDFPEWQAHRGTGAAITVADDIEPGSINEVDHFPHQTAFKRFVKENANTLSGLAYMAGSVGLLMAAWRAPKSMPGHPPHDWYRSYTSLAYFSAAAILVAMSQKADNPRDVYTIMESIYPALANQTDAQREQAVEQTASVMRFISNHPWEISMLLNASGAASHALSSFKRGRTTEMAAAFATLTACALSALIPEKGGRSMIPLGEWVEDDKGRSFIQQLEHFADTHPAASGAIDQALKAIDWMQENPLKLAAGVQAVANTGYAASGMIQKNYGLLGMSGAFFAGNYTQSQATKGRGDGFDSVVTAAASVIEADPDLQKNDQKDIHKRVHALASKLTEQREIVHPQARLERGIHARLKRGRMDRSKEFDTLEGFLPSERAILLRSPFALPSHVARAMPATAEERTQSAALH